MSFYDHFSENEREILRTRAERIAKAQKDIRQGDTLSVLVTHVGKESYLLPMEALTAVYVGHTIIPVPCVPPFIAGIANIRGQILVVLDLATLLSVPDDIAKQVLIVVSSGDTSIAFCVESVGEATTILMSELQPIPAAVHGAYLQGILPNRMALLDLEAIFNDTSLIVDETIS